MTPEGYESLSFARPLAHTALSDTQGKNQGYTEP